MALLFSQRVSSVAFRQINNRALCRSVRPLSALTSAWSGVEQLPADAILGIVADYKEDTAAVKVNVAQGAYRTDEGVPWVLGSVKEAERRVLADLESGKIDKEYLPIEGLARFRTLTAKLVLGEESLSIKENRVATLQTISGTGSLRVMASSLHDILGVRDIWVSDPSWGNHAHTFRTAGLTVHTHTYLDKKTGTTLDYMGMLRDLSSSDVPDGSAICLHACAHNPTGIDPSRSQWQVLAELFAKRKFIAVFDSAYQGYASGDLDADAYSVRIFEKAGVLPVICQSYAKSMGLYGERIGAVNFVCSSPEETAAVMSQVKQQVIRPMYSSPPLHGARLATTLMDDPELFVQWKSDLKVMSGRVAEMRTKLADELRSVGAPSPDGGDWSHITTQIGMFAYTGLTAEHVDKLRASWHVYMTRDGRMSMAGLKSGDIEYVSRAIKDVLSTA